MPAQPLGLTHFRGLLAALARGLHRDRQMTASRAACRQAHALATIPADLRSDLGLDGGARLASPQAGRWPF